MKEDILEQLVDDYLQIQGYFTRHNLKFRPNSNHPNYDKKKDSNHSDIDVIGINPFMKEPENIYVVSCKSWQYGFDPKAWIESIKNDKTISGRKAWKFFRELIEPKWTEALFDAVKGATGTDKFTYVTAITSLRGDGKLWEENIDFKISLRGNPIKLLSFKDMIGNVYTSLNTTVANSQFSRTLQLIKASGYVVPN